MSTSHSPAIVAGVHYIRPGSGLFASHSLGLYRDKQFCSLPVLPSSRGIRSQCQMISVESVIFVLGGVENSIQARASPEVYAFDLAAEEGVWQKRSSMNFPRLNFGVGALHGKLYVFGGYNCGKPVLECEVFDPKVNTWSTLAAMLQPRVNHKVAALGELFYIYGGRADIADDSDSASESEDSDHDDVDVCKSTGLIYDTQDGKWFTWDEPERGMRNLLNDDVFVVHECFHRLTRDGIDRYNIVDNSWTTVQSFIGLWDGQSFFDIPDDLNIGSSGHTILVGDELLTLSQFKTKAKTLEVCFLQTVKFNTDEKDIVLEIVRCSPGRFQNGSTHIFPLDL